MIIAVPNIIHHSHPNHHRHHHHRRAFIGKYHLQKYSSTLLRLELMPFPFSSVVTIFHLSFSFSSIFHFVLKLLFFFRNWDLGWSRLLSLVVVFMFLWTHTCLPSSRTDLGTGWVFLFLMTQKCTSTHMPCTSIPIDLMTLYDQKKGYVK